MIGTVQFRNNSGHSDTDNPFLVDVIRVDYKLLGSLIYIQNVIRPRTVTSTGLSPYA